MRIKCIAIVYDKFDMSHGHALTVAKSKINVKSHYRLSEITDEGVLYTLYASEEDFGQEDFLRLKKSINHHNYSEKELERIYGDCEPFIVK
jgi:hypothetical protein